MDQAEAMGTKARSGFLVGGAVAVAAIGCAAVLLALPAGSPPAASDEDRVRAVLDGMNGSYNRSDFDGFAAHLCTEVLEVDGFEAGWRQSRQADGPTQITVNSIAVTGGPHPQAVANVRFQAANHPDTKTLDIDFLREGAQWKACRYHAAQSV